VNLSAAPDTGFFFQGRGGDCVSFGSNANCSLTMSAARTVSATFSPLASVAIFYDGAGSGSLDVNSGLCFNTCTESFVSWPPIQASSRPALTPLHAPQRQHGR